MKPDFALNRLAFVLIAVLVFLIVLSAVIPQHDYAEEQILDWRELLGGGYVVIETLGLDGIYFTPFFFVILGLLGVTLIIGNVRRFQLAYRVRGTLLSARHIGSIVFHLSLLLIMSGIVLNFLFKFDGVFALTEGQSADDERSAYFRVFEGPLHVAEFGRFHLAVDKIHRDLSVDESTTEAADIRLTPRGSQVPLTATIRANRPLKWDGLEFHFGSLIGFSPEIAVRDTAGATLFRGFVRLAAQKGREGRVHADFVLLPEEDLKIDLKIEADTTDEAETCLVTVSRDDRLLYEGALTHTDTARLGSIELTFPRLRRWCYIDVVESPFLNLVFFGFWAGLGGMVIGFVPRLMGRRR